jgi:hypothetical protein
MMSVCERLVKKLRPEERKKRVWPFALYHLEYVDGRPFYSLGLFSEVGEEEDE